MVFSLAMRLSSFVNLAMLILVSASVALGVTAFSSSVAQASSFEAANNNIKILNYPVRYYARRSGAPNISRWIDGIKLLNVCWKYMISDI